MKAKEAEASQSALNRIPLANFNNSAEASRASSVNRENDNKDRLRELPPCLKNELLHCLTFGSLSNLVKTCKLWHQLGTPRLYFLDSTTRNSSAIRWCSINAPGRRYLGVCERVCERVLDLSVRHFGDVNAVHRYRGVRATALHFSSALGNKAMTRKLLEYNANVNALSSTGFGLRRWATRAVEEVIVGVKGHALAHYVKNWSALPMLCPFLNNDMEIVRLLGQNGATAQILKCSSWGTQPDADAKFTVFHYMAADDSYELRQWNFAIQMFRPWVDCKVPTTLFSALHLAVQNLNGPGLSVLLKAGAKVESRCVLGSTPLLQAVCSYRDAQSKEVRDNYLRLMDRLIKKRAKVDAVSGPEMNLTPLMAAVAFLGDDWLQPQAPNSKTHRWALIEFLVEKKANPNTRCNRGLTAVQLLCQMIIKRNGDRWLQGALQMLLKSGGDVTIVMPYTHQSLIYRIVANNMQPKALLSELTSRGSKIKDEEIDATFLNWIQDFRSKAPEWYDISQHREHISRGAVDRAFNLAFKTENLHLFNYLRGKINVPQNTELLIHRTLMAHKHKLWPTVLELPFDANFVTNRGLNFIHLVVQKFVTYEDYKESAAMLDLERFLARGTLAAHKDQNGKLPVKKLLEDRPSRDLENFLYRASMEELGLM